MKSFLEQVNGMSGGGSLPPTMLVIFGATGDLAADYLLPTLFNMDMEGLLPENFRLVCVGRRDLTTETFLDFIVKKSKVLNIRPNSKERKHFSKHLQYFKADFESPESFSGLSKVISDGDSQRHACYNRLYYFATSSAFFAQAAGLLKRYGLLEGCSGHNRQVRILVEKPFGSDLKTAKVLNQTLLKYFREEQIFRIDHYQGKETVQNLIVARFANGIFEPLWNKNHIDHIEVSVMEEDGAAERAEFYEATGALRDCLQNHILQIVALMAMDEPRELTEEHIGREKLKVLSALVPEQARTAKKNIVRGQYVGYEKDVRVKGSKTETFVALKAFLNLPRWKGVPFFLRTGKKTSRKVAEISVHFKEPLRCLFKGCAANVLNFQIQPTESVHLHINNKVPGFGIELHQTALQFSAREDFKGKIPSAYERLLLDFMQGDKRLFISSAETEAAWKYIDSVRKNWKNLPVYKYKAGSTGPLEADEFINREGKAWWTK